MDDADPPAPPLPDPTPAPPPGWQPLPARARAVIVVNMLAPAVGIACGAGLPLGLVLLRGGLGMATAPALALALGTTVSLAALLAVWQGRRVHRRLLWRADAGGLTVRRGAWWMRETHVPATRVQHLDLTRGPLQRRRGLATLVLHTAGTRLGAVTVPHLDDGDATVLRDALARQHAVDVGDA